MTPLELLGALSLGALAILAIQFGLVLYCFRGHRVGLEGVRIVRSDQWAPHTATTGPRDLDRLQALLAESFRIDGERPPAWSSTANGDSDRPPASVQHGQRTREVDGG